MTKPTNKERARAWWSDQVREDWRDHKGDEDKIESLAAQFAEVEADIRVSPSTYSRLSARITQLEAQQKSDHEWIDADAKTKEAQQDEINAANQRIAALEAALEKADALSEFLAEETCYPMSYAGRLRGLVCEYNEASAKLEKP
jgi:septal ring factor EnvC (AmiA/AmiB activator)